SAALDPQHEVVVLPAENHVDAAGKLVARRVQVRLAGGGGVAGEQPGEVGAAAGSPFESDAELLYEVVRGVRRWSEHAGTEAFDQALRVAFVPWRGEHDHRLAVGRAREDFARDGQRVDEQQMRPVVDRVR